MVRNVSNGQEAVEVFASSALHEYDAVLMDVRMPYIDGLEATRQIRSMKRSDAGTIPIIAMTADAFEEDRQRSYQAGMDEHLSKPLDPDLVYRVLAQQLAK